MKVKSKSDSTGVKKIKIFESLNLSGNYNFAAKDHPFYYYDYGQSSFFNNKLSLNTSLSLILIKLSIFRDRMPESEQKSSATSVFRDSMFRCLIL
jgi:hypothetical protein